LISQLPDSFKPKIGSRERNSLYTVYIRSILRRILCSFIQINVSDWFFQIYLKWKLRNCGLTNVTRLLLLLLLFEIRFFFLRIIIFATCHSHTYVGQSETTSRLVRWHLLSERGKNQFGKTRTNIFWFWIFLWTVMHFDTSHMLINWK